MPLRAALHRWPLVRPETTVWSKHEAAPCLATQFLVSARTSLQLEHVQPSRHEHHRTVHCVPRCVLKTCLTESK
jgi:hypothetical protein